MRVGVLCFPTDCGVEPGELAPALAERGFAAPFRFDRYSPLAAA
jgi:hypothetical protein